jgi:hypothetical protein
MEGKEKELITDVGYSGLKGNAEMVRGLISLEQYFGRESTFID